MIAAIEKEKVKWRNQTRNSCIKCYFLWCQGIGGIRNFGKLENSKSIISLYLKELQSISQCASILFIQKSILISMFWIPLLHQTNQAMYQTLISHQQTSCGGSSWRALILSYISGSYRGYVTKAIFKNDNYIRHWPRLLPIFNWWLVWHSISIVQ